MEIADSSADMKDDKKLTTEPADVELPKAYKIFLVCLTCVVIFFICLFASYMPSKTLFFTAGSRIYDLGTVGRFVIFLITAILIIPTCMPYVFCEMTVALLIHDYWVAVGLCMGAKILGSIIIYFQTRYTSPKPLVNSCMFGGDLTTKI